MLPANRFAVWFAVLGLLVVCLGVACGFPSYGGFTDNGSGGAASSSRGATGPGGGQGHGGASASTSTHPVTTATGTGGAGVGGDGTGGTILNPCATAADCTDPSLPICEAHSHTCVGCLASNDMCPVGTYCSTVQQMCVAGCKADADCNPPGTAGGLVCDLANHVCLGCKTDDPCPAGTICDINSTSCIPGCTLLHDCQTGSTCCSGTCADITSDEAHCGSCDTPCAPAHGTGQCVSSACTVAACDNGFHDCNGDPTDGCESEADTDVNNCGTCTTVCPTPANGVAACQTGTCAIASCDADFGDCDNDPSNGCETDLRTSPKNCGACGQGCNSNNGTATCTAKTCGINCDNGFKDCNNDLSDGCEVQVSNNVNNCGMCGNVCPPLGGTPACVNSGCTASMCAMGKGDCDGLPGNGCETNTTNDPNNCGGCGLPCFVAHGTPQCGASVCSIQSCNMGFDDCDGMYATGCETNLNTSNTNCGRCNNACANGHGTTSCQSGACSPICAGGFRDCDANPNNGCETDINNDPLNCGSCGHVCSFAHGAGSCQAGQCVLTSCNSGFQNCDLNDANGCEVAVNTVTNCGQCGVACSNMNGTTACITGVCKPSCTMGFADCDSNPNNGCEQNTSSSLANCGGCGTACSQQNGSATCTGGTCSIVCTAPFKDCNGNARSDGCEANTNSDPSHCGTCATTCTGGTPFCVGGMCQASACPSGHSDCDGNMGNGCECATSGCCGSSCQITHQDGLGQNFLDCAAVGTINDPQANEAAQAWNVGGIQELECSYVTNTGGHGSQTYFEEVVCEQTATSCACWAYLDDCTGFHPCPTAEAYHGSGHVRNTAGTPAMMPCSCPVDNTWPAWN